MVVGSVRTIVLLAVSSETLEVADMVDWLAEVVGRIVVLCLIA